MQLTCVIAALVGVASTRWPISKLMESLRRQRVSLGINPARKASMPREIVKGMATMPYAPVVLFLGN